MLRLQEMPSTTPRTPVRSVSSAPPDRRSAASADAGTAAVSYATPLQFRGGAVGALLPFVVFLGGVAALALQGAPDEKGFWPVLLLALATGMLLARDRTRFADVMLDAMSQRLVMVMICAWLLAGVLGTVLSASGLVRSLASGASLLGLTGGGYVVAAFLVAALVATATGTSFGTILLCGPILYAAAAQAAVHPGALMGAVLAGATFGDSVSPVSDTTIASSGTQEVDIGGTVRARLRYALPAGGAALLLSAWLGGAEASGGTSPAAAGAAVTGDPELGALVMLVAPLLAIGMLLARRHLVESLLAGIACALLVGLAAGLLRPHDVLYIDAQNYGARGLVVDGMQRAVGVSVFTILLVGLVGTLQATDVMPRLVAWSASRAQSPRGGEGWLVGAVSVAVLLTTHSVVAILTVGRFARDVGTRFGVPGYRRANLLDLTVCTWPFLLPYFLPTILAAGASRDAAGMPALTATTVGLYNSYAWMLLVMLGAMVAGGYGRRAAP
jgi:Na+/H+ antiporter NhaC